MKTIAILAAVFLTGCAMTPEEEDAFYQSLQAVYQHTQRMEQMNRPVQPYGYIQMPTVNSGGVRVFQNYPIYRY